jgi:hypothetical protein
MFTQLVKPNPNIPAEEGMCLQYVRQAFGLPLRYGSATEAWEKSTSPHRDRNFPKGVWFPVWWALDKNVNGHVALVAPDGRVYSTSNLNPNPVKVHPNLADVEAYYARYNMTLTYRGWSEDVAGFPVITEGDFLMALTDQQQKDMYWILCSEAGREYLRTNVLGIDKTLTKADGAYMNSMRDAQHASVIAALGTTLKKEDGGYIVRLVQAIQATPGSVDVKALAESIAGLLPEGVTADQVADELADRLKGGAA